MGLSKSLTQSKFLLRTALVVPFVVQIVAAVSLVGYLSFRNGQRAVKDLVDQLQDEISFRVKEQVQVYLEAPPLVNQINEDAARLGVLDFNDIEKSRSYLWKQVLRFKSIGHTGLANEQGQYLRIGWVNRSAGAEKPQLAQQLRRGTGDLFYYNVDQQGNPIGIAKITPNYDVRKRPLYEVVLKHNRAAWSGVYINFGYGSLQINASSPYFDDQGKLIGIFTCQMGLDQIRDFLQNLKIGQSGQVFMIEPAGELIASSLSQQALTIGKGDAQRRLKAQESSHPIMRRSMEEINTHIRDLSNLEAPTQWDFELDHQRYFLKISPLKDEYGLNWLIVVVVPENDFMAEINANTRHTVLLCLGALGLAIGLGVMTTRWITAPIRQITKASEEMATGDLNQHIKPCYIIELDKLGNSFNGMTEQLKDSVEALRLANEELESRVEQRTQQLSLEKERSEQLLLNILPLEIAERLKRAESPTEYFPEVTILFADIVGFTQLSTQLEPMQLVAGLNQIFSAFDQLTEKHSLEKIKTIGDAYMVVGGLPIPRSDHATAIADLALDMQVYMQTTETDLGNSLQLRIGINTGPVIAGVIGIKKFIYDLWGDAVNVASRMESHGKPGYIQITEATYSHLKDQYTIESRGTISVKGRGEMLTYWLIGKNPLA